MLTSKTHTILVIEQSESVRMSLKRVNLGAGFELDFIAPDDINELSDKLYAAVLADDYLFNGPGPEPPLVLVKNKFLCPVILMTASSSPRAVVAAKESGVDGVLQKPFSASDLRRVLSQVLKSNTVATSSLLSASSGNVVAPSCQDHDETLTAYPGQVAADGAFDALFTELERRQPLEEGLDAFDVVERHLIQRALETTSGNQSQAARFLGITRNTLRKRIRKYGFADLLNKDDGSAE